jgi:hypothetical protein
MGRPYFIAMLPTLPKARNRFDFVPVLAPGTRFVTALMHPDVMQLILWFQKVMNRLRMRMPVVPGYELPDV